MYTLISSNLMYPHNGKVMTKPKTLPIKLLDINEFLSSKGTHRAIMACKAGKVTPSNIPWKTLRTIKAQTFHLATTGLKKSLVICYQNCSDLLWEFFLKILGLQPWISKFFSITKTIYSNSERSEQFLVTEYLFLEVSQI